MAKAYKPRSSPPSFLSWQNSKEKPTLFSLNATPYIFLQKKLFPLR